MARILLVDDDLGIRTVVTKSLEIVGHEVVAFENADSAIDWLDGDQPDAIVTDLVMPTPGTAVVRAARAHNPAVPIVVLSGYLPDHDLAELTELGTTRFMEKPLRVPELVSVLEVCLGGEAQPDSGIGDLGEGI